MLNDNQTENLLLKKTKRSEANDIRFEFNWARIDLVSGINKFIPLYRNFLNNPEFTNITAKIWNKIDYLHENLIKIISLCCYIENYGTYLESIANYRFADFVKETKYYETAEEARKDADLFLFHFLECMQLGKDRLTNKKIKDISTYEPSLIREIPIIYYNYNDQIDNLIRKGFEFPLCILRGFLSQFDLNENYFSTHYLTKRFPQLDIEVLEQKKNFRGWDNTHNRQVWTINDYVTYLINKQNYNTILTDDEKERNNFNGKVKRENIYFGVNVDMDIMPEPFEELKSKLPPIIAPYSFSDALSYAREAIKGMTIPQFYLKENGVWTGGHQENNSIRSININHGIGSEQGDSEWYGMSESYVQKLADLVKERYNIDIYTKEGTWWETYPYFIKNKLEIYYGIQKPGDIVLVGPGCLHWVKSKGHSIHTSWNFCPKDLEQLKSCVNKETINKNRKIRSLVPMITLLLDILNFELPLLDVEVVKYSSHLLKTEIENSEKELLSILTDQNFKKIPILKELTNQSARICESCYREIFNYWGRCRNCVLDDDGKFDMIFCLQCLPTHLKDCSSKDIQLIYKYRTECLKLLLQRCEKKIERNDVKSYGYTQYSLVKLNEDTRQMCNNKVKWLKDNKVSEDENINEIILLNFSNLPRYENQVIDNKKESLNDTNIEYITEDVVKSTLENFTNIDGQIFYREEYIVIETLNKDDVSTEELTKSCTANCEKRDLTGLDSSLIILDNQYEFAKENDQTVDNIAQQIIDKLHELLSSGKITKIIKEMYANYCRCLSEEKILNLEMRGEFINLKKKYNQVRRIHISDMSNNS